LPVTTAFFVFAAASPLKPKATRSASGSSAWLLINGTFVSNVLSIGINVVINFLGTNFFMKQQ